MIYQKKGIIALITILVAGAIILTTGLGMTIRSIIESDTTLDEEMSHQSLVMATNCMEQALLSLADNSAYTGNETIPIGTNTCAIATITANGDTRIVKTSSTVGGYVRRLSVTVSNVNPPLQINSWQEVDN